MYLDTNILIYLFEKHVTYSNLVADILEDFAKSKKPLTTSVVTITEFLAGTKESSLATLHKVPRLEFVTLNENISELAAIVQRKNGLQIGDAIHLATAIDVKAELFFTNDKQLAKTVKKYMTVKQL